MKIDFTETSRPELYKFYTAVTQEPSYRYAKDEDMFVAYYNKKLLCLVKGQHRSNRPVTQGFYDQPQTPQETFTVFTGNSIEDVKKDLSGNWRWRTNYAYKSYTYGRDVGEEKIFLIKGTLDAFKKENPFAPMDIVDRAISEKIQVYHGWNDLSYNYALANFIGMYNEYPQMEQMLKTDLKRFAVDWLYDPANESYRRSFKNGKNISEITTMPNWLWKKLIENSVSFEKWEFIRIWNKQILGEAKKAAKEKVKDHQKVKQNEIHGFDESTVDSILNLNINDAGTLKKIKRIINNSLDENGKRIYTITTLFNYLERVDMYEAIPSYMSIDILSDYIRMCNDLNIVPRFDSDSLKREHDVTARNHNLWLQEKREKFDAEKGEYFKKRSEELQKYEYESGNYIAIVPKTIKDLIDEGRNNHNCVGSYVDNFVKGRSNVFFIRHKDNKEKSYITIELTSTCENRKQAFLGSNQPIRLDADWDFIREWLEHNKTLNLG